MLASLATCDTLLCQIWVHLKIGRWKHDTQVALSSSWTWSLTKLHHIWEWSARGTFFKSFSFFMKRITHRVIKFEGFNRVWEFLIFLWISQVLVKPGLTRDFRETAKASERYNCCNVVPMWCTTTQACKLKVSNCSFGTCFTNCSMFLSLRVKFLNFSNQNG